MYKSDFQEYLSDNTGVDFLILDDLFEREVDVFEIAATLINDHGVDKAKLGKIWGDYIGFAYVDPNSTIVKTEYVEKVGIEYIYENTVLPLYKFGKAVTVATSDPENPYLQDKMEKILDEIVSLVFCFPFDIGLYVKLNASKYNFTIKSDKYNLTGDEKYLE